MGGVGSALRGTDVKRCVLILGAGGGGGNNLIRSLRKSSLDLRILGTNCLPHCVAKSTADETYLMPECSLPDYLDRLVALVKQTKVDLIIPNNDREVAAISHNRDKIPARVFLPSDDVVRVCQDKDTFIQTLSRAGKAVPLTRQLSGVDDIESCMASLPRSDKYWVRPRRGSGSKGATWVRTADQARKWIELWVDLRGFHAADFQIANFLPGRDYNVQTIWKDGRLIRATMVERLSYFGGEGRLSGMTSTPEIAISIRDDAAFENSFDAIKVLSPLPHGSFNIDMKGDAEGKMHLTEINIGRFPMITTIHDAIGRTNGAEAYVKCAFDEDDYSGDAIDFAEGVFLFRDLDVEPLVINCSELDLRLANSSGKWRDFICCCLAGPDGTSARPKGRKN